MTSAGSVLYILECLEDWPGPRHPVVTTPEDTLVAVLKKPDQVSAGKCSATRIVHLEAYGPSEDSVRREIMEWVRGWAAAPVAQGSSVRAHLQYRGCSLWWFLDPWWSLLGANGISTLHETVWRTEQCRALLQIEVPGKIVCSLQDRELGDALQMLAENLGIPLHFVRLQRKSTRRTYIVSFVQRTLRFLLRSWIHRLQGWRFTPREQSHPENILVHCGDHWGQAWDAEEERIVESETYLHNVFRALKKNYAVQFVVELGTAQLAIRNWKRKCMQTGIGYKPFEAYAGAREWWDALGGAITVIREWMSLRRDPDLSRSAFFNGLDYWPVLRSRIDSFMTSGLLEALLLLEGASTAVGAEKPLGVVVDSRMGKQGRALIHAARQHGIPSFSVEHSFFLPENIWDFLAGCDIEEGRAGECPLPDKILIYGSRDRELMLQNHFPASKLKVVGAPRWDGLPFLREHLDKQNICEMRGLDPSQPIVLLTTQNLYPIDQEDEIFRTAYAAVNRIPGAQLVVKLHPLDRGLAATTERYQSIAAQIGQARLVLCDGYVLQELLWAADVLVSLACNTAIEATLLNKPVILLDVHDKKHHESFFNHPVLLQARTEDGLYGLLGKALFESSWKAQYELLRDDFVRLYCHKNDGKAWKRVWEAITSELDKPAIPEELSTIGFKS